MLKQIVMVYRAFLWRTDWLRRLVIGKRDLMLGRILDANLETVGYEWHPYKMKEEDNG